MSNESELAVQGGSQAIVQPPTAETQPVAVSQPVFDVATVRANMDALDLLYRTVLTEGADYGIIPGTKKPRIHQPGAEKILGMMRLGGSIEVIKEVEDYDKGFWAYRIKVTAVSREDGACWGEGVGCCNSLAKRYLKQDKYTIQNTVLKQATIRAFRACALTVGMASERFGTWSEMEDENENLQKLRSWSEDPERGFNWDHVVNKAKKLFPDIDMSQITLAQSRKVAKELTAKYPKGDAERPKAPQTPPEDGPERAKSSADGPNGDKPVSEPAGEATATEKLNPLAVAEYLDEHLAEGKGPEDLFGVMLDHKHLTEDDIRIATTKTSGSKPGTKTFTLALRDLAKVVIDRTEKNREEETARIDKLVVDTAERVMVAVNTEPQKAVEEVIP